MKMNNNFKPSQATVPALLNTVVHMQSFICKDRVPIERNLALLVK